MFRNLGVFAALAWCTAASAVPLQFTHQARLADSNGVPQNGSHDITLELWSAPTGGIMVWDELHSNVDVQDGFLALQAGSIVTLDSTDFDGSTRYLVIKVNGTALSGRSPVLSVPYALRAGEAEAVVGDADASVGRLALASETTALDSDACAGVNEGEMRWTGSAFQGCTPDGWVMLTNGRLGMTPSSPAPSCKDILESYPGVQDGLYWLDPAGNDPFQAWCFMTADYPGATLAIRKPGSIAGMELMAGDLNLPCTPSSGAYCRLSDVRINALRQHSDNLDAYISRAYKIGQTAAYCTGFARKACVWNSDGAASGSCENSVVRNSGQYCSRNSTTASYRGIDGYICPNLTLAGVHEPSTPFIIFEHSGGTHYCGGHDTTWDYITLSIQ